MAATPKTRGEKLFSAAVLRRSFELRGEEHAEGFQFVYQGVLRDLAIEDAEVLEFIRQHRDAVEQALGRKG